MPSVRVVSGLVLLLWSGAALAQEADPARAESVSWSAQASAKGDKATVTLNGTVQPGWHVYALKQAPEGPTPLLVTLDKTDTATASGAASGSPAIKFRDPAFGLDTQYYEKAFSVSLPVKLKPGAQAVPVSVRFQTCNGRICQPPKTVHLSAPVNQAGG